MHWYTRDGQPCYEIKGANGAMRAATLRDARKLGLLPGVTTILNEAAKPQLERWKVRQGILAALTLPREDGESLDAFAERAMRDSEEQAKAAADRGTAIHDAVERHYRGLVVAPDMRPFVDGIVGAINDKFGELVEWTPEATFGSDLLGYGGKVDLHAGTINGCGIVVDLKGKDGVAEAVAAGKPLAYDEHAMQLAAYANGLGLPRATVANVFFDRQKPGIANVYVHVWDGRTVDDMLPRFACLLEHWQLRTGYRPRTWMPAA